MTRARLPTGARGETTRTALLDAATRIFGRDGFSAATTKAIAREAGANQALISYHFGGKEGLYAAVIEHIVDEITSRVGPVAAGVEAERKALERAAGSAAGESGPAGRAGNAGANDAPASLDAAHERYLDLLCRILDALVDVLTSDDSMPWARIIVREQQEPSAAFEVLYSRVQGGMLLQVALLIARISGRRTSSSADRLTALTIMGQVLMFRVARATTMRFMEWDALRPREIKRIKRMLRHNVRAMLSAGADADA